jgi:RHH-type rel operon transcriptional repressor/antitoxin RelB
MTLAIRLPPQIEQRPQARASKTRRSKALYVREAIVRYVEDLEDERLARATREPRPPLDAGRAEA